MPSQFCNYVEVELKSYALMTDGKEKKGIKNEQNITKEQQHKHTITQLGAKDKHLK